MIRARKAKHLVTILFDFYIITKKIFFLFDFVEKNLYFIVTICRVLFTEILMSNFDIVTVYEYLNVFKRIKVV